MSDVVFKNQKVNPKKLLSFGFVKEESNYMYQTSIVNGQLQLKIKVSLAGQLQIQVIDSNTNEEYVLHLTPSASGEFVGQVSTEYQAILNKIKVECYDSNVFKAPQAIDIIKYVKKNYDDQLEFLWKKFPQNAIWRRSDTYKWYGLLSTIPRSKLGLDSNEIVTVLDVRGESTEIERIVDNIKYFPGYHMNKIHWYTMILDGSVSSKEIMSRIQDSYLMAH